MGRLAIGCNRARRAQKGPCGPSYRFLEAFRNLKETTQWRD